MWLRIFCVFKYHYINSFAWTTCMQLTLGKQSNNICPQVISLLDFLFVIIEKKIRLQTYRAIANLPICISIVYTIYLSSFRRHFLTFQWTKTFYKEYIFSDTSVFYILFFLRLSILFRLYIYYTWCLVSLNSKGRISVLFTRLNIGNGYSGYTITIHYTILYTESNEKLLFKIIFKKLSISLKLSVWSTYTNTANFTHNAKQFSCLVLSYRYIFFNKVFVL